MSESRRSQVEVQIIADGRSLIVSVPAGSTVMQALQLAGVSAGSLDKTDPPPYVVLSGQESIRLVRVIEQFRTEVIEIPFERQVLRNDSLPEGEERLVQAGVNGEQELTYRAIIEDGTQTAETVIKSVVLREPTAEIVMIGSRSGIASVAIPGRLAYLSGGNAWVMDGATSNRRLLVNTGDLDGRVFALSPDGRHLLYTRRSSKPPEKEINSLWAVPVGEGGGAAVSLRATNIVHFADWYPDQPNAVAFSTVEPRANAPGWQANNDLYRVTLGGTPAKVLDSQSGGVYGWWGTAFTFSPSGRLAYARPDGIGLVIQDGGYLAPIVSISAVQTRADWAWVPEVAWGSDSQTLLYVDHRSTTDQGPADGSARFDLRAVSPSDGSAVTLVEDSGMFSWPTVSPRASEPSSRSVQVAYLQAIFPEESDVSRYRLAIMDRDGSNRREVFPGADLPGLDPQKPVWAPGLVEGSSGAVICVIYNGDLWLIDTASGEARQITSDGLISGVDWQ